MLRSQITQCKPHVLSTGQPRGRASRGAAPGPAGPRTSLSDRRAPRSLPEGPEAGLHAQAHVRVSVRLTLDLREHPRVRGPWRPLGLHAWLRLARVSAGPFGVQSAPASLSSCGPGPHGGVLQGSRSPGRRQPDAAGREGLTGPHSEGGGSATRAFSVWILGSASLPAFSRRLDTLQRLAQKPNQQKQEKASLVSGRLGTVSQGVSWPWVSTTPRGRPRREPGVAGSCTPHGRAQPAMSVASVSSPTDPGLCHCDPPGRWLSSQAGSTLPSCWAEKKWLHLDLV